MKLLVVLLLTIELTIAKATYNLLYAYHGPPAPLSKDGKVIDTPEVAHAKAAHFAAYAHVAAKVASHQDEWTDAYKEKDEVEIETNEISGGGGDGDSDHHHHHKEHYPVYHGPPAPLGHDGRVIDTEEVAHAKAAHLAALERAKALAASSQDNHYHHHEHKVPAMSYHVPIVYHGPPAPLAPDGQVIDTPEVAKARDAHLYAYHHAKTLVANDEYSKYDGKNRE